MRTNPTDLVSRSIHKRQTWFEKLSVDDQVYVQNVINVMRDKGDIPIQPVVEALIKELHLTARRTSVRELIRSKLNAT
jgi:predicted membrane protein